LAELTVVYWRDIPAQVIVKAGRAAAKRELPPRFAEAIDMAAMRSGAAGTDAYLAEWRRAVAGTVEGDLDAAAAAAATRIDGEYPKSRLLALVAEGGREVRP
jgi:hypothetical protein